MSNGDQAAFLQGLANALNSKEIALPSFPDVVIQIRTALEDPTCDAERLANVARTDPILVTRVLRSANSAFHNRAGIEIVDLSLAIGRLGFETVRNTAITLAVEQIFNASQHEDLKDKLKEIWNRSIELSSMSYVLAQRTNKVNPDNSFLCGLLHDVGKLYILTQARDYPNFLGDSQSLQQVTKEWSATVGRSILESWGFSEDIASSLDASAEADSAQSESVASLSDVVASAHVLLNKSDEAFSEATIHPSLKRLEVTGEHYEGIADAYQKYLQTMRQTVSG